MQQPPATDSANVPPGPDAPVSLGIDEQTLVTLSAMQREYGDIVQMPTSRPHPAVLINTPEGVRQILVRRHPAFRKGRGFERVKMLLGNGLIVSDDDIWRRSRRMIQPVFKTRQVARLVPVMAESVRRCAARWQAAAVAGDTVNLTRESSVFALETILCCIFGEDIDRDAVARGDSAFSFLADNTARDLDTVKRVREVRQRVLDVIACRRKKPTEAEDFLDGYIAARDKNGEAFDDRELLDELMTLVIAGFETSANTLVWAWYSLAGAPDVVDALIAESDRVLGAVEPGDSVSAEQLTSMPRTMDALDEVLRLYPPVWLFTRRVREPVEIDGFTLAEGTDVYLSPYLMQRDPARWAAPEQFDPSRFAAGEASRAAFFPFSLGPRRCLGEHFSYLEMALHLGQLLPRFDLQRVDGSPEPTLDFAINLRTREDIRMQPKLRPVNG